MSEEQIEKKMKNEENSVLIIMGIVLGIIWVVLVVIDVVSESGLAGFIYFFFGIINIGVFLLYILFRYSSCVY